MSDIVDERKRFTYFETWNFEGNKEVYQGLILPTIKLKKYRVFIVLSFRLKKLGYMLKNIKEAIHKRYKCYHL